MPNKYTAAIDAASPMGEEDFLLCPSFDAIFGKWEATICQGFAWNLLGNPFIDEDQEATCLFFCFLAEMSDQDLEECFPEIFPLAAQDSSPQ